MPGADWRDLVGGAEPAAAAVATPALDALMAERRALEARMAAVTGGAATDPRTAALYTVEPMSARRAQHDAWQRERERDAAAAAAGTLERRRADEAATTARLDARPSGAARAPSPPPALRPTAGERTDGRPRRRADGDTDLFGTARDLAAGARRKLGEAREALNRPGLERERAKLDRALERSGVAALERTFDRASTIADAPARAKRVIADEWSKRRDRIAGPDLQRFERGYRERAEQLLGVAVGSVAELGERLARGRAQATERRQEADRLDALRLGGAGRAAERRRAGQRYADADAGRRARAADRRREAPDDVAADERRRSRAVERRRAREAADA